MRLKDLIKGLKVVETSGDLSVNIKELKCDSNQITKDCLFICIKGADFDGHEYFSQASSYGAVAFLTEKKLNTSIPQVIVKDTRIAMSIIAGNFYENACRKLKIIGVTGTNGKTTTTYVIKRILDNAGIKCGVIGTIGVCYLDKYIPANLTTPDPIELHSIFLEMYKSGVEVVVMEVSAHALKLGKLEGIKFEVAIFTNLTQDHLDFFGNIENYKQAKLKLFEKGKSRFIVANSDDVVGREILRSSKNSVSYGIKNPADVFAINIKEKRTGTSFTLNLFDCIFNIKLKLLGIFNVYNALASAEACALIGVPVKDIEDGLMLMENVAGRMELINCGEKNIYIDYAHTPDGLKQSILSLKAVCEGRLTCVFGCGGNRDESKRKIMGEISGEYADFTVITTDNPRYEEPMDIINQIEEGVKNITNNYIIVQNRKDAISYAIKHAQKGDVVLIAGKGSESYQEILGIKQLYNDKDTVEELLSGEEC